MILVRFYWKYLNSIHFDFRGGDTNQNKKNYGIIQKIKVFIEIYDRYTLNSYMNTFISISTYKGMICTIRYKSNSYKNMEI